VLADGTPYFAPLGEVLVEVTVHLRGHGWTKQAYCAAFGLERGQSLEGPETRKLRAAAFTSRLVFDPAVRAGSAAGRERARSGALARDAAAAATGRHHPEQRRRKASQAHAGRPAPASGPARAVARLAATAARVAAQHGYPDIGTFVLARVAAGDSLAAISRSAGLHKDWLSRHLADIDPRAAAALPQLRPARPDTSWQAALGRLGFPDVPSYLRDRYVQQHRTASAIAAEAGLSHHTVQAALRRHGLAWEAHTAKRHGARERAAQVAADLGFGTIAAYVGQRRAAGWTWRAMSAESGQPESWLRRQAGAAP
jgi:lambda repressor-like predicted transcriptional regulator